MSSSPDVSVIIPTAAEPRRRDLLLRAIDGIVAQAGVRALPVVVVNGSRFDPGLRDRLEADPRIRYHYQPLGSAPEAQLTGRRLVETPYFAFLDDDDELLPGALARRKAELEAHPDVAVVIDNGYSRTDDGVDEPRFPDMAALNRRRPVETLLDGNWMHNSAALFRTSLVPPRYFEDYVAYMEWTYVAFRLALDVKFRFVDGFGYRINSTEGSLSKGDAYAAGTVETLTRMLAHPAPPDILARLRNKRVDTWHNLSVRKLQRGELGPAWRYHWRCLGTRYGLRYLSYTRHLLAGRRRGTAT